MSQEQLAYRADVDRAFISDIERGVKLPSLTTIFKLAQILEVKPSEIVKRVEQIAQFDLE